MKTYRIAALPGDGIGPECMSATQIVLDRIQAETPGLSLEITPYRAGAELYRDVGVTLPDTVVKACIDADAVLLSAIGLPDVRFPDGTEVQPTMMVGLRRRHDVPFGRASGEKIVSGCSVCFERLGARH